MAAPDAFQIPGIDIDPPSDEEDVEAGLQPGEVNVQQDERKRKLITILSFLSLSIPLACILGIFTPIYGMILSFNFGEFVTVVGCASSVGWIVQIFRNLHEGEENDAHPVEQQVEPPVEQQVEPPVELQQLAPPVVPQLVVPPAEGIPVGPLEERRRARRRSRAHEEARRPVARRPVTRSITRDRQARRLRAFRQYEDDDPRRY